METLADSKSRSDISGDCRTAEYNALKSEQVARIGFRDNLLYVTLAAMGAVLVYGVLSDDGDHHIALLAGPWVAIVLGWSYSVNDHVITQIARYCREVTVAEDCGSGSSKMTPAFLWERIHTCGRHRIPRKLIQLIVDVSVFPVAGALFCFEYVSRAEVVTGRQWCLIVVSLCLLCVVCIHIMAVSGVFTVSFWCGSDPMASHSDEQT